SLRFSNGGGAPTAVLMTAFSGADPAAFTITSDGCGGTVLDPAASCDVHLAFRPSEERQFSAQLQVSAGAASASVAVSGRGDAGTRLSLSGSQSFGGVDLGRSATTLVTVSNTGASSSSPLSFDASGDTASFVVASSCTGVSLPPGARCEFEVAFSPQT